ncbi:MAG: serpin family protein [Agriterribacter sp.]
MRAIYIFLLTVLTITFFSSCTKEPGGAITKNIELPSGAANVIHASGKFGFDLFNSVVAKKADENILVSPLSIFMAVSMVYNGADNATKDSIAKALQVQGISIDDVNAACKALIEQMPGLDNKVNLSIANAIWYKNSGMQPLPSFLDVTANNFKAEVSSLDFSSNASVNIINNWVADKTNDKIKKVIDAIDPGDLMYLINAIYFKGSWQYAFKSSDTYTDVFHVSGNENVTVPFMKQRMNVNNAVTDDFEMIELPYGGGKSYSMYIVLPRNASTSISAFVSNLHETKLQDAIATMRSMDRTIIIPSWEYEYSIDDLRIPLSELGMGVAFSDFADFSKLYAGNVAITKALHKTYIKVNEEGTEAAAVTVIGVGTTSTAPGQEFKVDRPFVYVIAEKQSGSILFSGILHNPLSH